MFNKDQVKLADFDLAKIMDNGKASVVGTPYYLAPEVIKGRYNTKCDIWSLGVVLLALFQYSFVGGTLI